MMEVKLVNINGSLVFFLPDDFVEEKHLNEDDKVFMQIVKDLS